MNGVKLAICLAVIGSLPGCTTKSPTEPSRSAQALQPPVSIKEPGYVAIGEGCCNGPTGAGFGAASFAYSDKAFDGSPSRGFNIAVVDRSAKSLLHPIKRFDTWSPSSNAVWTNLAEFIQSIPTGGVVMLAVEDEAGLTDGAHGGCGGTGFAPEKPGASTCCQLLTAPEIESARRAIESLGSTEIRNYCYHNSWSMISVKGEGKKSETLTRSGQAKSVFVE